MMPKIKRENEKFTSTLLYCNLIRTFLTNVNNYHLEGLTGHTVRLFLSKGWLVSLAVLSTNYTNYTNFLFLFSF